MSEMNSSQNSASILLEIGTEEIPSRFLPQAIGDLSAIAAKTFEEYRIEYAEITVYATPRRLSLIVNGAAPSQKDNIKEVFGPAKNAAFDSEGNPTKAATGFASSLGLAVSDLRLKQKGKGKGEYVVAVVEEKGIAAKTVLPELLKKIILSLHFPKSMRWGNGSMTFVRPIAWILAISGAEKIEFDIDGLKSSNQTRGHRFLSPASFQIKDISAYRHFLETNFVLLDQNKRRDTIVKSMAQLIQNSGLQVIIDEGLIETVNYLVEYPVPVLCSFDKEYLRLPKELLITVMKDHQKYFALQDAGGYLANNFIVISNTKAENADTVRIGAQRVIKARFDDAKFYYSEDSARPLADRIENLRDVTFHARLGTLLEKTERIALIAGFLADRLCPDMKDKAVRAARLCKTDLITGVVREFPELQGIMGKYYAHHDREERDVADALEEQYMPKSFGDRIPQTEVGAMLSLADKIDNIASFFSIGLIPTGSEDPFALRRQAMGIVSIFLERGYSLGMQEVFGHALKNLQKVTAPEQVMENITNFMSQRTEFILSSAGHDQEIIRSVLQLSFVQPLSGVTSRIVALAAAKKEAAFADFLLAIKRVNNIVPKTPLPAAEPSLFQQDEEKNLSASHASLKTALAPCLEAGDFPAALKAILPITPAINGFFDKVLVMDKREEIKTNRLSLLREIWESVAPIADFSRFQS
ncbi:MAG: glycine--tRNA ligase subunit beta [Nitrospirae bacterium]|nr:glycine--tRNA ligase subunit beta [Nitrospirota bacterium]